jgi:transcriptional regulator with GAF, ATPase, and Fis domain
LIVATNRNLSDLVARGDFRSDLFYRIGTFPIKIPPLRERREDIPSLVFYFLHKYAAKHKKSVPSIPEQFMNKFLEYSWPGNIRELEHIIERMLILSESGEITIPDFEISPNVMPQKAPVQNELLTLDEISRRHILMVLNHVKWRIRGRQGAAEILGLKPSTLEYRIKRLGINR